MQNTIELTATTDNLTALADWLHNNINLWNLSDRLANKIDVCSEEVFVNISSYAYRDETGTAKISIDKNNDKITLRFEDTGIEYNPLLKDNPDITLSYQDRPIGGLGILLLKEFAHDVEYKRNGNKNILTLKFIIE